MDGWSPPPSTTASRGAAAPPLPSWVGVARRATRRLRLVQLVAAAEGVLIVAGGGVPLTLVAFSLLVGTSVSPSVAALSAGLVVVGIVVLRAAWFLPRAAPGARWTLAIFHVAVVALAVVELPLQPAVFWPVAALLLLVAGVILHALVLDADTAAAFRNVGALRSEAMTRGGTRATGTRACGTRATGTSVARSAGGVAGLSGVVALSIVVAGVLLAVAFAAAVLLTWAHGGAG